MMGIVKPPIIPPPHRKKNIPVEIPMDWDVLNVFHIVNPEMLISYEDITPDKIYSNTTRNKMAIEKVEEKVEKLFTQPKELFEAVDFNEFDIAETSEPYTPKFIEGENYALQGVACDGFEMETKVYKLIKVVDDFYGTNINSVIVKQISGEQGIIFTLS